MAGEAKVLVFVLLVVFSSCMSIATDRLMSKNSSIQEKQGKIGTISTHQINDCTMINRKNKQGINAHHKSNHVDITQYGSSGWYFSALEYRIPIIIANISNYSLSYVPVIAHFNFTDTFIRPHNYSLLLGLYDMSVDFQIMNYRSNGTHLLEFDLVFSLSGFYADYDVFYLYFSIEEKDLSSYGITDEIYSKEYFNNDLDSINISSGYISIEFYDSIIGGEIYKFMKVYDGKYSYDFLLSYLQQSSGYIGFSSAIKSGLLNVTMPEMGYQSSLFATKMYINSSTVNLSDLEDSLNGPYRFMTHALYIYNGTMDFYGVYAPVLENATIKRITIGPLYLEVSFEITPLGKYYEEGTAEPSTIDVYENITFYFSYYSGMLRQKIIIANNLTETIIIDDNSTSLGGLTEATYGSYRRYTTSPDDHGSMIQFFTWMDDKENPEGDYARMGNINGLPDDTGTDVIDNNLFIYGVWTSNSLGRINSLNNASLIMQVNLSKYWGVDHVVFTGSYMVYPNDSYPALYDGMYSVLGFDFPQFPLSAKNHESIEFTLQFSSDITLAEIYHRMHVLALPIVLLNEPSSITNIQYINSTIQISLLKLVSQDGFYYTNASLYLYYNNRLVPYNNFTIKCGGMYYYKTYYYSTILTGNFVAKITKRTDVGTLNYTVDVAISSANEEKNITLPLIDLAVSLYDPTNYYIFNNTTVYYYFDFYSVEAKLLSSDYTNTTMQISYTSACSEKAILKDIILGSYQINIIPDEFLTYGVPCDEMYNITLDWYNGSYEIEAHADVARVNFIGIDGDGNRISFFTINLSGINMFMSINSSSGIATFRNVPLENRTTSEGVRLNATIIYNFLGVYVSNTTSFSAPEDNHNVTIRLEGIHAVFISVYSKAGENIILSGSYYLEFYIRNETGAYGQIDAIILTYEYKALISVPDTLLYNLAIYLKTLYYTYNFDIVNESYLGHIIEPTNITIIMPVILYLTIDILYNNGTEENYVSGYAYACISTLNKSYVYSTSVDYGSVYLENIPSNVKFNVTIEYYARSQTRLINSSIVTFNDSHFRVIFYFRTIKIYAAPQYNASDPIAGVSLNCYINQSYICYATTNKSGYIIIQEFPHPVYGYTNLTIDYYWFIYDYYLVGTYSITINETVYYTNITMLLPLKKVYFILLLADGTPTDGSVDIYTSDGYNRYLATVAIENGNGTFELCPVNSLDLVFVAKSRWAYSIIVEHSVVLQDPVEYVHITVPLETANISVVSLDGTPLANSEVSILIFDDQQKVLVKAYGITNSDGTTSIVEIPYEGSTIVLNGSSIVVGYITVVAKYKVIGTMYVSQEEHLDTYQKIVYMPLGRLIVSAYYNSSEGKVILRRGVLVDLIINDNIYQRLNLSISNTFDLVPYNASIILYMIYKTRYNVTLSETIRYRLLEAESLIEIPVPMGDFTIEFIDFDCEKILYANVTLKTYELLYEIFLNNTNNLSLMGVPFGIYEVTVEINTYMGVVYKQIAIVNFVETGFRVIKINTRNICIDVYDSSGNPLNGLYLIIRQGNYEISVMTNSNKFYLTNLPLGIYMIDLYYRTEFSMYPLNYTGHVLDISTTSKTITLYAEFAALYSEIVLNKTEVYQYDTIRVGAYIYDVDGKAITNLSVVLNLRDRDGNIIISNKTIEEYPGYYVGYIQIGSIQHGKYKIAFEIVARGEKIEVSSLEIRIKSKPPEVSFSISQYLILALVIVFFSSAVILVQRRLLKTGVRDPRKNVKYMTSLYGLGMVAALSFFGLSYIGLIVLEYKILAYALSFLLVIILYGLWIYIDGYKSIKLRETGKIGFIFGLVHMIVPIYIMMQIISAGATIEWFQEYIIEQQTYLGPLRVPILFASFLSAYVTTYLVIALTAYRDINRAHKKIVSFYRYNVSEKLIESETHYQLMRLSGAIRIRILLFLGLLGISIVTSLPFLQDVGLLIVIIPIVLLIIGPYISYVLTGYITKSTES